MAVIQKMLPIYYTTLHDEYGLSYSDIQALDAKNEVYVLEVGKADKLKQAGNSDSQILDYYRKQGYNVSQVAKISTYLASATVVDATTGKTGREKLTATLATITIIANTALPIVATIGSIFGFNKATTQTIQVPDLATYKPASETGTVLTQIDTGTGNVSSNASGDAPKVDTSLIFGFTPNTIGLIVLFLIVLYILFQQTKTK